MRINPNTPGSMFSAQILGFFQKTAGCSAPFVIAVCRDSVNDDIVRIRSRQPFSFLYLFICTLSFRRKHRCTDQSPLFFCHVALSLPDISQKIFFVWIASLPLIDPALFTKLLCHPDNFHDLFQILLFCFSDYHISSPFCVFPFYHVFPPDKTSLSKGPGRNKYAGPARSGVCKRSEERRVGKECGSWGASDDWRRVEKREEWLDRE